MQRNSDLHKYLYSHSYISSRCVVGLEGSEPVSNIECDVFGVMREYYLEFCALRWWARCDGKDRQRGADNICKCRYSIHSNTLCLFITKLNNLRKGFGSNYCHIIALSKLLHYGNKLEILKVFKTVLVNDFISFQQMSSSP